MPGSYDDLGLFAQIVFWGALLLGLAVGGAIGAWKGFHAGGATACLIMGILGLAGSTSALVSYWRFWQEPNAAEATVLRTESSSQPGSSVVTLSFTTRDGQKIETNYTGESAQTPKGPLQVGDTIGVLYGTDPSVVTLHSVRGSLLGGTVFGMFSAFATLAGVFFIAQRADLRARRRRPVPGALSVTRSRVIRRLTIGSNFVFVAAFVWLFLGRGDEIRTFGVSLAMIAVAALGYATVGIITPAGPWSAVMIPLIVAVSFALFSVLIRLVT